MINQSTLINTILAEGWKGIEFLKSPGGNIWELVIVCVMILVLGVLFYLLVYVRQTRQQAIAPPAKSKGLFTRLCTEHQLKQSQTRFLLTMAQHARLSDPAELFIRKSLFEETVHLVTSHPDHPIDRAPIDHLGRTLFGDLYLQSQDK